MFDQAQEETLMGLVKEPEKDPLENLYHRQLKKYTLMKHADQVRRKEQKSYAKLTAVVTDILEIQQQETLFTQKERGRARPQKATPIVPDRGKDGKNGDLQTVNVQRFVIKRNRRHASLNSKCGTSTKLPSRSRQHPQEDMFFRKRRSTSVRSRTR